MERVPPLDQVSSQALTRLAAERGLTPSVTPASEDLVRPLRRSWTRFLPYLFFGLSLFALLGMVLGVTNLADDGWSIGDVVQLILMALLVLGVFQQARGMLRQTRLSRLAGFRRSSAPAPEAPVQRGTPLPLLDAVSAEELAATRPAALARAHLREVARTRAGKLAERAGVIAVVTLATLAFLGMLFLCGYIAYAAGPGDPGLWLTVPFAGLTGFGTLQIFRSARRAAFRGRPWALIQRAFRDSVRVWGSGSLVSNVLLTSTATASVAGAAIVPIVAPATTPFDLFLVDNANGAVFRVDLATMTSASVTRGAGRVTTLGMGTTGVAFKLDDGKTLPSGSLVVVVEGPRGAQTVVGYRPGQVQSVSLTRLDPPLPGAQFAVGQKFLFALQPDGTLTGVDLSTGDSKVIGSVAVAPGPIAYDPDAKALYVFGANTLTKVSPATGKVLDAKPLTAGAALQACGVARGNKGTLWITEAGTGKVFTVAPNKKEVKTFTAAGELPTAPCAIAIARRR